MKKTISIGLFSIIFLTASIFLTACNQTNESQQANQNHENHQHHEHTQPPINQQLNITFSIDPTEAKVNQPVTLISTIKADDTPVTDAKVEFEVWKEEEDTQMLSASMKEAGNYQIEHTFSEAGTYHVVVHVTTPHVHQMISETFTVK